LKYQARKRARPKQERELAETYRNAWRDGDGLERAFVMEFLYFPVRPEAADLVLEGLKSSDIRVIQSAVKVADLFMDEGVDLGPEIRPILENLRR
jgi:hypothetical protein